MIAISSTLASGIPRSPPSWEATASRSTYFSDRPLTALEEKLERTQPAFRAIIEETLTDMARAPTLLASARRAREGLDAIPVLGDVSGDGPDRALLKALAARVLFGRVALETADAKTEDEARAIAKAVGSLPAVSAEQVWLPSELRSHLPPALASAVLELRLPGL